MKPTAEFITEMAKAGAQLSRHCRDCWTGEKTRNYVRFDEFSGRFKFLWAIERLPGIRLLEIVDNADLQQVYLNPHYPDQHLWRENRWEAEIRQRISPEGEIDRRVLAQQPADSPTLPRKVTR